MSSNGASAWRIAVINTEEKPCAIIRDDGPWGDEFVAHSISLADARTLAAIGITDCLPQLDGQVYDFERQARSNDKERVRD